MTAFHAQLVTENLALVASLTGGTWSPDLPLTNLIDDRIITNPARCLTPASLATSQFDIELEQRRIVRFFGLFATNFSVEAMVRLTFADDAEFTIVTDQIGWVSVFERFRASLSLDWEDPNFWTGTPLAKDLDLYGRHKVFLFDTPVSTKFIRVEIDDAGNPDGFIDIGYAYLGATIATNFNMDRGRTLNPKSRARRDETPSGHPVFDRRRPKRVSRLSFSFLTDGEAAEFIDAGMRNDVIDPVVLIPDPTDQLALMRETFLGRFQQLPSARYRFAEHNQSELFVEEILA